MALKTKIDSAFWSDDDIGRLTLEHKLAILWLLTNKDMNNIGFLKVSRRQFEFDTGLKLDTLEAAIKGLARGFVMENKNGALEVLAINYVHYQFSDRSLSGKNNIVKHLCTLIRSLSEPMQEAILTRYPDLKLALHQPKPLPSSFQGACKPPEQSRAEQSRVQDPEGMQGEEAPGQVKLRFDLATTCIDYLNHQAGTKFPASPAVVYQVAGRLQETGNDLAGVKRMIDRQVALWKNDARMKAYLRPVTLFDEEKFSSYFGQRDLTATPARPEERRKELETLIERSPANRESVYHQPSQATDADRQQLAEWKRELRGLNKNSAPAEAVT